MIEDNKTEVKGWSVSYEKVIELNGVVSKATAAQRKPIFIDVIDNPRFVLRQQSEYWLPGDNTCRAKYGDNQGFVDEYKTQLGTYTTAYAQDLQDEDVYFSVSLHYLNTATWFCYFPVGAGLAVGFVLYLWHRYPEDKWKLLKEDWDKIWDVLSLVVSGSAALSCVA